MKGRILKTPEFKVVEMVWNEQAASYVPVKMDALVKPRRVPPPLLPARVSNSLV